MIKIYFSDDGACMRLDTTVKSLAKGEYTSIFPESGLHPSKQMDVTEGLFEQYKKGVLGETVHVATHSELVILRALRMLRENRATIKDFELWQVCTGDFMGGYITQIELSEDGEFLDHIKDGFFEQGFKERFA